MKICKTVMTLTLLVGGRTFGITTTGSPALYVKGPGSGYEFDGNVNALIPRYSFYSVLNEVMQTVTLAGFGRDNILLFDFDGGHPSNDSFGLMGRRDPGLGLDEASIAPGDSGGALFIDGHLAGVHSFGMRTGATVGTVGGLSDSGAFGEVVGSTRISSHLLWLDSVNGFEGMEAPEPKARTLALLGGLVFLLGRHRRQLNGRR